MYPNSHEKHLAKKQRRELSERDSGSDALLYVETTNLPIQPLSPDTPIPLHMVWPSSIIGTHRDVDLYNEAGRLYEKIAPKIRDSDRSLYINMLPLLQFKGDHRVTLHRLGYRYRQDRSFVQAILLSLIYEPFQLRPSSVYQNLIAKDYPSWYPDRSGRLPANLDPVQRTIPTKAESVSAKDESVVNEPVEACPQALLNLDKTPIYSPKPESLSNDGGILDEVLLRIKPVLTKLDSENTKLRLDLDELQQNNAELRLLISGMQDELEEEAGKTAADILSLQSSVAQLQNAMSDLSKQMESRSAGEPRFVMGEVMSIGSCPRAQDVDSLEQALQQANSQISALRRSIKTQQESSDQRYAELEQSIRNMAAVSKASNDAQEVRMSTEVFTNIIRKIRE
ncbi:hypothetical protein S40288_11509 [Stachybotrys chartarum IBT 40288]|nr:hypothetical protein S40288_11509 [Stachybotrys chartarum IBT 40288]